MVLLPEYCAGVAPAMVTVGEPVKPCAGAVTGVVVLLVASDFQVSQYADFYFEYDSARRVTKEIVQGGSRTFTFSYSESANADGYNSWKTKTVETLPGGTQNIVYSNYAGQTMLHVFKDGADEWLEFWKYTARILKNLLHARYW